MVLVLALSVISCGVDPNKKSEGTMTYAEYNAAALDSQVVIEGFVQAKQAWWSNKGTFYLQDGEGAYFIYELPCTEEEYNKMTVGTKLKITGVKTAWAGEVEIVDATFEILADEWVAEAEDVTSIMANEAELIKKQNCLVKYTDLTVKSVSYKNNTPGDDIYVSFTKGDAEYNFCVEFYLNGSDEAFYNSFAALNAGDVVDVEGFLYWYNGNNTHITKVTKK